MYIPKHHEENDLAVLHALMRAHPLGTWVITGDDGAPIANHIPFLVDAQRGAHGTLVAHVARANPVWRSFPRPAASLVVFQGAESYITPSWYASKRANGKVVPTWNYAVVHAHGEPRVIEDRDWILSHVSRLTETHEASREQPWKVTDAPADFIDSLLRAIVGIEIPIARIEGKWKITQHRSVADRLGVVDGLMERGGDVAQEMAEMMRRQVGD